MLTRSSGLIRSVVLVVAALAVACGTTKPKVPPTLSITSPTDGSTLTAANGTLNGTTLTLAVTGTTDATAGSAAKLTLDGAVAGTTTAGAQGQLTWTGIALSGSAAGVSHTLTASVADSSTLLTATAAVTVTVKLSSTSACTIALAPADGAIFNETGNAVTGHPLVIKDEDTTLTGMQAKLTVTGTGTGCDGQAVTLTVGGAPGTPTIMTSGVAVFDQTLLPDTAPAALAAASQELTVTPTAGTGPSASSVSAHYIVDSVNPMVALTSPMNGVTLTSASDVDPNRPGLQINVAGTDLPGFAGWLFDAGATLTYDIVSTTNGTLTPLGGTPSLPADGGPFMVEVTVPNGQQSLFFSAATPTGNTATSNQVAITALAVPVIGFVSPTPDQLVNSDYGLVDGGVQFPIKLTTTASPGSVVTVCSTVPNGADLACPNGPGYLVGTGSANGANTTINGVLGDDGAAASQTLTVYVTDGGASASAAVTIEVHIVRPLIDAITVAAAFDAGGQLWWNASNVAGTPGTAQGTVTVTLDPADTFVLQDGGSPSTLAILDSQTGSQVSSARFSQSSPTAATVALALTDNAYPLTVSVKDIWGNVNSATQSAPISPSFDLYVKTATPTCAISSPQAGGFFSMADNGGVAATGNVSVPVGLAVTSANGTALGGGSIPGSATVAVNGTAAGSAPTATPTFLVGASSPQGTDAYTGAVTDPAGNPAAVCTGDFTLTVDTVAPTLAVTVDPDPTAPSGDTYTTTRTVTGAVTPGSTLPVGTAITVSISGGSPKTLVTVATVGAALPFSLANVPNGTESVVATATDPAGNPGQGSAPVVMNATGCDLILTAPAEIPLGGSLSEVLFNNNMPSVTFHTSQSSCVGTSVTFFTTPQGGSTTSSSANTDSSGNVTFLLTGLSDGSSGTLYASIATGVTLAPIDYFVKLSTPAIGSASPGVSSFTIVANQDNPFAGTDGGPAGANGFVFANAQADTSAAHVDFSAAGLSGLGPIDTSNNIGKATLTIDGAVYGTKSLAAGATGVTFANVTLPANNYPTGSAVKLTVTDSAGNSATHTWTAVTDVVPPGTPAVAATMQDKHAAAVQLAWTVPAAGGGTAIASYEARYLVSYLQTALIGTPSAAQYAAWTADATIAGVTGAAGAAVTHNVSGLPTFDQYTFEVRAIDQVGNRSALGAAASVSSVAQGVANSWQQLTIVGADGVVSGGGTDFGYVVTTGHFTSGQYRDLVITTPMDYTATALPGVVYVLYGTGSYASAPTSYTGLQALQIGTVATGADFMGYSVAVGDFNGDGIQDLAVGSPAWNSYQGRVDLFFGSGTGLCGGAATCSTPSVTLYGTANSLFGYGVSAIGDLNKDGIADLLVGAPTAGPGGTAYLFLGTGSWPMTPVARTAISSPYIGDGLGARFGSVGIGDLNGDSTPDFAIGAPGGGIDGGAGNVYFVSGAVALANATMTVDTTPLAPLLTAPGICTTRNNYAHSPYGYHCFGETAVGDVSFTGGAQPDLVVGSAQVGMAMYPMTIAGAGAASFVNVLSNGQGQAMVALDLNGDGKPDLISGVNDVVGNTGYVAGAYVYLNTGSGLTNAATAVLPPSLAPSSNPAGDYFGYGLTAADLRNQGSADLVISDVYPNGRVTIYY